MTGAATVTADLEQIRRAVGVLLEPGATYELRMPNTARGTVSGYYNDFEKLAEDAGRWNGRAPGVYVTLNPVNPPLLARSANRLTEYAKHTTSDSDIVKRRWLPMDFDAVRPAGISSTADEHATALACAGVVATWLAERGWPKPIVADSGNGGHLLYRVDLLNTDPAKQLVERCLKALAVWFSDNSVAVDTGTFNTARIWKLYGTLAAKGDNLPERPHRLARILESQASVESVPVALLEALAALAPTEQANFQRNSHNALNIEAWLKAHGLEVSKVKPWQGGALYELAACPWNAEHQRSARVIQFASGALSAACFHNSCSAYGWRDLRETLEPPSGAVRGADFERNGEAGREVRGKPEPGQSGAVITRLSDVVPESVSWVWRGYLPVGRITILEGDPGLGKSTLALDLAARVSTGAPMPDGTPTELGGVVIMSLEDGLADTIVPRLKAAGADLTRCVSLDGVGREGKVRLPTVEDTEAIWEACEAVKARMVIIDPLMGFISSKQNSWRDQDMRSALGPLAKLGEELGVAVVVIRHLNKAAGGQAIYRGGGSIGIVGAARTAFLIAKDPEAADRQTMACIKNNLAKTPPSLSFSVEGVGETSRIVWEGVSAHTADALLAVQVAQEERPAMEEAKEFLRELLANGPVEARAVQKQARVAGISAKTLHRAKTALGVLAKKEGMKGGWFWMLAEDGQEVPKMANIFDDHLRGNVTTFADETTPGGLAPDWQEVEA